MKLDLSFNLKRLRRERALSQEQLGELLGVTSQAISHWECGAAYPDLETVPVIAGFFGVTTDELLGVSSALAEKRRESYFSELESAEDDDKRRILRDAWREFPKDWEFAYLLCRDLDREGARNSDEILRITYDVLDRCTDGWYRALFTEYAAIYESDEKVYDFLDRIVTDRDIRSNKLLELRYKRRGELEVYDAISHFNTARDTETLLFSDASPDMDPVLKLRANLEYLNMISGVCEDDRRLHPVLGDGVVDMWVDVRVWNGFHLGCRLAERGDVVGALSALEETAEVCANFLSLQNGAVLSYRTDLSGRLNVKVKKDADGWRRAEFLHRVGLVKPGRNEKLPAWPPDFGLNLFTDIKADCFRLLGSLSEHPRFKACVERLRALTTTYTK